MLGTILTNAADVIILVLLFGATIFIHEFGHFIAAIKLGLVVDVFSIGFGPALWQRKINGVVWKISAFPLGGYVALPQLDPSGMEKIQGENNESDDASEEGVASDTHDDDATPTRTLPDVEPWKRIVVSVAGPIGNVIFGLVLAMVIYLSPAAVTYKGAPVVDRVVVGSAAQLAGLRAGDEVVTVNGKRVDTWYNFAMESLLNGTNKPIDVMVMSGHDERQLRLPLVKVGDLPRVEGLVPRSIPCMLQSVTPGGPAAAAGLLPSDIVKRVGTTDILSSDALYPALIASLGKSVEVTVDRDGSEITVTTIPSKAPLRVRGVSKGSVAGQAGLRVGDRILQTNGDIPVSGDVLFKRIRALDHTSMEILVERDDGSHSLNLVPAVGKCIVGDLEKGYPAASAGFEVGDSLLELNGERVEGSGHFSSMIVANGTAAVDVLVSRDHTEHLLTVVPKMDEKSNRVYIGIVMADPLGLVVVADPLGVEVADLVMPWMQEKLPFQQLKSDAMGILRLLKALIDPAEAKHAASGLGGPAMIITTLWVAIKLGLLNAVGFLRFLNINLAILNLLPIPVLDGGHIVFATWEGITRRKVHPKVVAILVNGFAILLITAFLALTVKDVKMIGRLFGGSGGKSITVELQSVDDLPAPEGTEVPVPESTP